MDQIAEVRIAPVRNVFTGQEAHASRWGWHACSRQTFRQLKRLHKAYWKDVARLARWHAWVRKAPQNRVIRNTVRNAAGQVVRREAVRPMPEPERPRAFDIVGTMVGGVKKGRLPDSLEDFGLVSSYETARKPFESPEKVPWVSLHLHAGEDVSAPLSFSEAVDRLYSFVECRGGFHV